MSRHLAYKHLALAEEHLLRVRSWVQTGPDSWIEPRSKERKAGTLKSLLDALELEGTPLVNLSVHLDTLKSILGALDELEGTTDKSSECSLL